MVDSYMYVHKKIRYIHAYFTYTNSQCIVRLVVRIVINAIYKDITPLVVHIGGYYLCWSDILVDVVSFGLQCLPLTSAQGRL